MPLDNILMDQYRQGSADAAYYTLGAHRSFEFEQNGYRFTLFAPNARSVELIGSFSGWSGWRMEPVGGGFWSIFAKDIEEGELYKFRITPSKGESFDKADPFAFSGELRPKTASVVTDLVRLSNFKWDDDRWIGARTKGFNRPMSIYEVHAGSWRRNEDGGFYSYKQLANELIPYVKDNGFTHVELMPLTEYPFDQSWGYQSTGYFSPTSRYGDPTDLMDFVNTCHENNIGVILDFVAAHFVHDSHGLSMFDGSCLFESENKDFRYSSWGTSYFDFTQPHVLSFMKSSIDYWLNIYHFDGIRFDAVSNLIHPEGHEDKGLNESGIWMMKSINWHITNKYPGVLLIAEDSSRYIKVTAPVVYGGLGFDYKWCLNWMHDIFDFFSASPGDKIRLAEKLYSDEGYFFCENYILPFSHDEVVYLKQSVLNKMYCLPSLPEEEQESRRFDLLRCLYLYMFAHPGKKLIFMGNEIAVKEEWDFDSTINWDLMTRSLHRKFKSFLLATSKIYRQEPSMYAFDCNFSAFKWLEKGRDGVFAFVRKDLDGGRDVYALFNLTDDFKHVDLKIEQVCRFAELINTDGKIWGGNSTSSLNLRMSGHHLSLKLSPRTGYLLLANPD